MYLLPATTLLLTTLIRQYRIELWYPISVKRLMTQNIFTV